MSYHSRFSWLSRLLHLISSLSLTISVDCLELIRKTRRRRQTV